MCGATRRDSSSTTSKDEYLASYDADALRQLAEQDAISEELREWLTRNAS